LIPDSCHKIVLRVAKMYGYASTHDLIAGLITHAPAWVADVMRLVATPEKR